MIKELKGKGSVVEVDENKETKAKETKSKTEKVEKKDDTKGKKK